MFLKPYSIRVQVWKWITWPLILVTLISQLLQLPFLIEQKEMNQLILHGTALIIHVANPMVKLNIELYKSEMAHLINHVFVINSSWGKLFI